nr:uncharacterized protein LOC116766651 [Danaus plexippus plexippus]
MAALLIEKVHASSQPDSKIVVDGTSIVIGPCIKYLGLVLDSRLRFLEHYQRLAPRLVAAARSLGRILTNIGGPPGGCRRLYINVVRSMALYGAPIWVDSLGSRSLALLRRPQRILALRVVRAYRTLSYDEWVGRKFGSLTYRLTQLLTGHGCFGRYLCQVVQKEPTTTCHHCRVEDDTAQHTRQVCPAWNEFRADLVQIVGPDLSLSALINSMVGNEESWQAVLVFAEKIMLAKEAAEREREQNRNSLPVRRSRVGRRR